MLTLDELMARISEILDPEEIVDLLHLTSRDLVEAFSEKIGDEYERITNEIQEYGTEETEGGIEGYDYYV